MHLLIFFNPQQLKERRNSINTLMYHVKIITIMLTYIALKIAVMCNDPYCCLSVHPFITEFCLSVAKDKMASGGLGDSIAQLIN